MMTLGHVDAVTGMVRDGVSCRPSCRVEDRCANHLRPSEICPDFGGESLSLFSVSSPSLRRPPPSSRHQPQPLSSSSGRRIFSRPPVASVLDLRTKPSGRVELRPTTNTFHHEVYSDE